MQDILHIAAWLANLPRHDLRDCHALKLRILTAHALANASELADIKANANGLAPWLADGIAKGGICISRRPPCVFGWIPTPLILQLGDDDLLLPDADAKQSGAVSASLQREAGDQAAAWAEQWCVGTCIVGTVFPRIGAFPAPPSLAELHTAIVSFWNDTVLATHTLHPCILFYMSAQIRTALLAILCLCELLGEWASVITDVLMALLLRKTGGLRHIGIFPRLTSAWMRTHTLAAHPRPVEASSHLRLLLRWSQQSC